MDILHFPGSQQLFCIIGLLHLSTLQHNPTPMVAEQA